VKRKICKILTASSIEESKLMEFSKEIKARSDIIQFIKSHKNEEVFYVCVFPSMKHEDILIKLERKMCLKIGKIKDAKLCSNENNVLYINVFDIRHFKRDQIACILSKKLDILNAFKNVIVICEKKENLNHYNHVVLYGTDRQIEQISKSYLNLFNNFESQNPDMKQSYIENCIHEIEETVNFMIRHKPAVAKLKFLQIIHQIRRSLNLTITADTPDDFFYVLNCFYDLHKKYFECKKLDNDYVNTFIAIDTPYLSEDCIEYMKSDIRFRDLFINELLIGISLRNL
jgi:hypothetical protein